MERKGEKCRRKICANKHTRELAEKGKKKTHTHTERERKRERERGLTDLLPVALLLCLLQFDQLTLSVRVAWLQLKDLRLILR